MSQQSQFTVMVKHDHSVAPSPLFNKCQNGLVCMQELMPMSAQACLNEGQRNAKKGWITYGNE
jgi:hypothetical protein